METAVIEQPEPLDLAGREHAVAQLYRREYPSMVRLAHLITGSNEVAEDLVQDSFVRLYHHWGQVDQPGAYLRMTVINRCKSWHRRRRLERESSLRPLSELVNYGARELLDALARLTVRQRTALVLRYYVDLSVADVARALGCRPGTAKSLVHRSLRRLEGMIER